MAVIVSDTFDEGGPNVDLDTHTPTPTGTGWTEEEITGIRNQVILSSADIARASGNEDSDRHLYTVQPNPSIVSYDVEAELAQADLFGADDPWFLIARFTDTSNYYSAGTYEGDVNPDKKIFKTVAGVVTELASGESGIANGDVLKFEIRTAAKKLYKNDAEELSTADNALISSGRAGFGLGNAWVSTNDIGNTWRTDNFVVTEQVDVGAGGPAVLLGSGILRLGNGVGSWLLFIITAGCINAR